MGLKFIYILFGFVLLYVSYFIHFLKSQTEIQGEKEALDFFKNIFVYVSHKLQNNIKFGFQKINTSVRVLKE